MNQHLAFLFGGLVIGHILARVAIGAVRSRKIRNQGSSRYMPDGKKLPRGMRYIPHVNGSDIAVLEVFGSNALRRMYDLREYVSQPAKPADTGNKPKMAAAPKVDTPAPTESNNSTSAVIV